VFCFAEPEDAETFANRFDPQAAYLERVTALQNRQQGDAGGDQAPPDTPSPSSAERAI
jgi:hypothetical protein